MPTNREVGKQIHAIIGGARHDARKALDRRYVAVPTQDLRRKLTECEKELPPLLQLLLIQLLRVLLGGSPTSGKSLKTRDGHVVAVSVMPKGNEHSHLDISALILDSPKTLRVERSVDLPRFGRLRSAMITLGAPFSNWDLEQAERLVREVFAEANQWYERTTLSALAAFNTDCGDALYRCLDDIFASRTTERREPEEVWFSVFRKEYGVYLLRSSVVKRIYNHLLKSDFVLPEGPCVSLAYLVGLAMPYKMSLSKEVISANKCLTFDLPNRARYAEQMDTVLRVEATMIGLDKDKNARYRVCPIVTDTSWCLVAGFPEQRRTDLEATLTQSRDRLGEVFRRHLDEIEKHAQHVKNTFPEPTFLNDILEVVKCKGWKLINEIFEEITLPPPGCN